MFIRKSRVQLGNFVISDAKRLLQHNHSESGHFAGGVFEGRTPAGDRLKAQHVIREEIVDCVDDRS